MHKLFSLSVVVLTIICILFISACAPGEKDQDSRPAIVEDGWVLSTPQQQGLDPDGVAAAFEYAARPEFNSQAVVVVRHGKLVAEWYAPGNDAQTYGTSWSVGKSFASALIGIAIMQGLIESIDVPMTRFIPEWEGTDKADITLQHVLSMSTGLAWIEEYGIGNEEGLSDVTKMLFSFDQLQYAINQQLAHEPGTVWYYSSGTSMLMSRVIEAVTGVSAGEYAQEYIFDPLGMESAEWWSDGEGHTLTYCCLDATARDFAKFGLLFLQQGWWEGRQIVTEEWVQQSTTPSQQAYTGYGLQWWLNNPDAAYDYYPDLPLDIFMAFGYNGQYIYVLPSQDMVVVRLGEYIKPEVEPVAVDGLFGSGLWSDGFGPTGSKGPDIPWDDNAFLQPILAGIVQ